MNLEKFLEDVNAENHTKDRSTDLSFKSITFNQKLNLFVITDCDCHDDGYSGNQNIVSYFVEPSVLIPCLEELKDYDCASSLHGVCYVPLETVVVRLVNNGTYDHTYDVNDDYHTAVSIGRLSGELGLRGSQIDLFRLHFQEHGESKPVESYPLDSRDDRVLLAIAELKNNSLVQKKGG